MFSEIFYLLMLSAELWMTKFDVINNQDFIILINEMKNIQIQIWCQDPFVFFLDVQTSKYYD